jgi:hypothetical protein
MKKLYLLFISLFALTSGAQTISIPDANFKAALVGANPANFTASDINGEYITIDTSGDGEIQISEAANVYELYLVGNDITNLTGIQSFTNVITLDCSANNLTGLDVSGMTSLEELNCSDNVMTTLVVTGCTGLHSLQCETNELTSLDLAGLSLSQVLCANNFLSTLNVTGITTLEFLSCGVNSLATLDLTGCTSLFFLSCPFNLLTSLDVSGCNPDQIFCEGNYLTNFTIKNGHDNSDSFYSFSDNPLEYICADENEIQAYQDILDNEGMVGCVINSYCSFNPGGIYYTISGLNRFDADNDGCESSDGWYPSLKFSIVASNESGGTMISNSSGAFGLTVPQGDYIITPMIENPSYFNVEPASINASFPAQASPYIQDFCISPNGTHADLEVSLIPLAAAVPGFDAGYRIVYKNKGNQTQSGTVTLTFEDSVQQLVSSLPPAVQTGNLLSWSYANLLPTESRQITLMLHLNAQTDTPAVNIGDELAFSANILGSMTDENTLDNTDAFTEVVVGSLDPNDKTCLEGDTVSTAIIGDFVHYLIRFENTGTFPARNIVVKDMIDTAKFDIATLAATAGSHPFVTRITHGDTVEFIFENINLPFDNANNDGYVAFKIKTQSTLVAGNTFSNAAAIYFDYNFPVITNTATTTIQALGISDFNLSDYLTIYPNPVTNTLNLSAKNGISISSVELYNTLGQLVLAIPETTGAIDVSQLRSGNYFIKVHSDRGDAVSKFIKQ